MRGLSLLALLVATPALAEPILPAGLEALPPARIVLLGETHDNPVHHDLQARAIAAIRPSALVWEMLTSDQAARMPLVREDAAAVGAALGWEGSGWPDFAMYFPLIQAAGPARHFGAGLPRQQVRGAFAQGAAAVFAGDAARFGLDRALPPEDQAAREAEQFAAHCAAMPMEMMGGMVEAQRLRDAELARVALEALEQTGGPVVVITGSGHARRDQGIPAVLALAAPDTQVLSLAFLESDPGEGAPFDLWLVTPPAERADPCASLR